MSNESEVNLVGGTQRKTLSSVRRSLFSVPVYFALPTSNMMMKSLPFSVINQNHGPKIQFKKDSEVQENWTKLIDGKVGTY